MPESTDITAKTVLITGANRGIGRALLDEALRRGAKRVYAGARGSFTHPDERVAPLRFDVTDDDQLREAAQAVSSLDILVNNAGLARSDDLADRAVIEHHLAVNLFGIHGATLAFLPQLTRSSGAVVNILSVAAFVPLPIVPAYSISKAAAYSLTQSQRTLLAGQGIRVYAVHPGPTDTDMSREFDAPKASPAAVARAVFAGVNKQQEDIFPDSMSLAMAAVWQTGPARAVEREYAAIAAAQAAAIPSNGTTLRNRGDLV
jgi:NAD(P)-dependent dehydrogenase (short-subunit alcohol dehydrogenase family)